MTPYPHLAVQAHAKLNLSLRVLAQEVSGYHQIETLFCALELADDVEVAVAGSDVRLRVETPGEAGTPQDLGPALQNLAFRAALLFQERAGTAPGTDIRLTKRVPAGAGLGGGSSDAAAVLRALNHLHGQPLSSQELLDVGALLGSDVPFFLAGAPLALAWGRGGRIAPLPPLPQADLLLALPTARVATADAYRALAAARDAEFVTPSRIITTDDITWADVAHDAVNDFEDIVFQEIPQLSALRLAMLSAGAVMARLTGTGSAVFGIFENTAAAEAAAASLRDSDPALQLIVTRTRGSES